MRNALWVGVLMLSAMPASAGFYKCQDASGKTYFSDRACTTRASAGLKSGDDVPKLTEKEARVEGGSMSLLGDNEATKERLKRDNPGLYRQLQAEAQAKGVSDLGRCKVRGDGVMMRADCQ